MIKQLRLQYGDEPLRNKNYGKIINEKHFDRLLGLIDKDKIVFGGDHDRKTLRISPVIMDRITWEDAVMGEEIFGPVLPVLTFRTKQEALETVCEKPCPLALYIFSSDKKNIADWKERISFGGGCINDTLIHLATSSMGFGGVGASGMGAYHGKCGFDAFTHYKSMVDKKTVIDLPIRYQPYTSAKDKLIRMFVK